MDTQTRHALKQDKLITTAHQSVDWLQEHRDQTIKLVAALLVVAAALIGGLVFYLHRSTLAETGFGEAMDVYSTPLAQPGEPAGGGKTFASAAERAKAANQQFMAVADRYPTLLAGKNARYFAGLTAVDMGQNNAAESDFKAVANHSDRNLASLAKLALANLYAQTDRPAQAVTLYQELIDKPTTAVPAQAAKLQLAAMYESTNPAEARRIYAELKNDRSAAGQIAAEKLGQP